MKHLSLILMTLALSACASSQDNTVSAPQADPAYISPNHYANYNCDQIAAEMQRISGRLEQAQNSNMSG